jgi:hypothetical protein
MGNRQMAHTRCMSRRAQYSSFVRERFGHLLSNTFSMASGEFRLSRNIGGQPLSARWRRLSSTWHVWFSQSRAAEVFAYCALAIRMAAAGQRRVFDRFDVLTQMAGMKRKWEQCAAFVRTKDVGDSVDATDRLVASDEGAE